MCGSLISGGISVYILKLYVDARRFVGRCTKRLGTKAAFASKPVCIQRKKEKDDEDHKKISVARDVHESWKNMKCTCVFVGHGLRSASFVLGVAKKSEVPICSSGHP